MKKITTLCLLLASFAMYAQTITGHVSDNETHESLPFVEVINTKSNTKTLTNIKGEFNLTGNDSDTLLFKYIGFQNLKVIASECASIEITPSLIQLDEVVISVNREQQKRTESPIAITVISSQTIEDYKPTSIDQVLNQTAGVNMVDLGNEQHTMSIRRPIDYGASYLYLEDGVPIRTSGVFNHNALLEINMANTRKIEIIRGPASSMYGSEAIGGAVNFISKRPTKNTTAGITIQGNNIGYKRNDFYASGTIKNKLGLRIAGYYANKRNGIIEHSDFDKFALSLMANYYVSENTEFIWNNSFVDYYADMSGSLDSTDFYEKTYTSNHTFTNRKVNAYRSKFALNHYWSDSSKTTITAYFRNNAIAQNPSYRVKDDYLPWLGIGNPNLAHGEQNENSFHSYGIIGQHKQDYTFLGSSIIVGASLDYSPNDYKANYIIINKNDEGDYDSFTETDSLLANYTADLLNTAAYFKYKFEPLKGLRIMAALRFDNFNYNFDNHLDSNAYTAVLDGKNNFARLTPKLGFTYDLKNNRGVYANYSQGFVPPQVSELYRGNNTPDLLPVYYNNVEIGGWISVSKERGKIEFSAFKMDGRNEIISVLQNDGSTVRENAGSTTHQGIEYTLHYLILDNLKITVAGTNALHKFVDFDESGTDFSGNKMPQSPSWIANMVLTYKPQFLKGFRSSIEWRHIDNYFMDQHNTKSYDGYNLLNLRFAYEWKSLEVWTNILNLSGSMYANVARASAWGQSYSLGNPRNFNFGIGYKFKK